MFRRESYDLGQGSTFTFNPQTNLQNLMPPTVFSVPRFLQPEKLGAVGDFQLLEEDEEDHHVELTDELEELTEETALSSIAPQRAFAFARRSIV